MTRTLVFSDVHGNLPALEAMLAHAGPVDRYVSLGDVVNYGPWSDECVERIAGLPNCEKLIGNHERAFLEGSYPGSHPVAQAFFEFCYPRFKSGYLIQNYAQSCMVGDYLAVHTIEDRYIFADTQVQIYQNYLIGHSHHSFIREIGRHKLVNVGSVGQNRRNLQDCCYAIHGPGAGEVRIEGCRYDARPVIDRMHQLGYPGECIDYYLAKLG